jgi:hypothetical protein
MRRQLPVSLRCEWVAARYGVERPQFLSSTGTWGIISSAEWFRNKTAAQAAVCPAGSTATAVHMALSLNVV